MIYSVNGHIFDCTYAYIKVDNEEITVFDALRSMAYKCLPGFYTTGRTYDAVFDDIIEHLDNYTESNIKCMYE